MPLNRREFIKISGLSSLGVIYMIDASADLFSDRQLQAPADLSFTYFNAANLLQIEIEFYNIRLINNTLQAIVGKGIPTMRVKLPPLHKAEDSFKESPGDKTAKSYLSHSSWLVFDVTARFTFTIAKILNWNAPHYKLRGMDGPTEKYLGPTIERPQIIKLDVPHSETTTLEMPTGIYLSPYIGPGEKLQFLHNNLPPAIPPVKTLNELISEFDNIYLNIYQKRLDSTRYRRFDQTQTSIAKNAQFLWNNALLRKKGKELLPPRFKIADVTVESIPSEDVLPGKTDRADLFDQFYKDSSDKEFIESTGEHFLLTSLGAYAKLAYQSSNPLAILQKWKQEIVISRDQYIETQRLGFLFPFGHRVAEVEIGERVIENGVSYIRRKRVIKRIDEFLTYRTATDEADDTPADQLQSILHARQDPALNKLHSWKRSLPYSSLSLLTTTTEPIQYIETSFRDTINTKIGHIENTMEVLRDEFIVDKLEPIKQLMAAIKPVYKTLRKDHGIKAKPWIAKLIEDQSTITPERVKITIATSIDNVGRFLSYLTDFSELLDGLCRNDVIDNNNLVIPLQKITDTLAIRVRAEIVRPLIDAFDATPDHTVDTFRATFASDAQTLASKKESAHILAILNFNAHCQSIKQNIDAMPHKARPLFVAGTEEFFGACEEVLQHYPQDAKLFAEKVKPFRLENSPLVSFTSTEVDRLRELILSYWPRKNRPYQQNLHEEIYFDFSGTDWEGNVTTFSAPAIFVRAEALQQVDELKLKAAKKIEDIQVPVSGSDAHHYSLDKIDQLIQERGVGIRHHLHNIAQKKNEIVHLTDDELKNYAAEYTNALVQMDVYLQVREAVNRVEEIDNIVRANYRRASNATLRRIDLAGQKLAYYKMKTISALKAEENVTSLETLYLEFGASGMAQLQLLRDQVANQTANTARHLTETMFTVFPQIDTANVRLPVMKDFSADMKGTLISYSDAFRQAGVETIRKLPANSVEKEIADQLEALKTHIKDQINTDEILFEVKKFQHQVKDSLEEAHQQARVIVRQRLGEMIDPHTTQIKSDLDSVKYSLLQTQMTATALASQASKEFEHYIAGATSGFLGDAGRYLGGALDPGPVCSAIARGGNNFNAIRNDVDNITGAVKNKIRTDTGKFIDDARENIDASLNRLLGEATIFGLSLTDVLDLSKIQPANLPGLTITKENSSGVNPIPTKMTIRYDWVENRLGDLIKDGGMISLKKGLSKNSLQQPSLKMSLVSELALGSERDSVTRSSIALEKFGISIGPAKQEMLTIYFKEVVFETTIRSNDGNVWTSSSSKVEIANVEFSYYLSLIQQLQSLLGLGGFLLDITPQGIQLSLGVRMPTISTGPFTITNASLYAGVVLPFSKGGVPSVRFSFAERSNPFTLAAGIFGGRGFVALTANAKGLTIFEASLEFGGYLGLNLGVASGQAYLMGGIYFRGEGDGVYVEAYIVCGGSLSIAGIITVSVVFHLGMGYKNGALTGTCSLRVSVSLLFFSASYTLRFSKTFSGESKEIALNTRLEDFLYAGSDNSPSYYDLDMPPAKGYYQLKNSKNAKTYTTIDDPSILFSYIITNADALAYSQYYDFE
jgi:hypothetical protein